MSHLYKNDLITKRQHGFVRNKACSTNLLESFDMWTKAVSEKQGMDIVFLDYAKAFDKVSHKMLLHKLESYGIGGKLNGYVLSCHEDLKELYWEKRSRTDVVSQVASHRVLS